MKKKILFVQIMLLISAALSSACFTTSCTKEETQIKVTGVSLDKTEITLVEGEIATLVATVIPENALNKKVVWKSYNTSVATVDDAGKVTAVNEGMTTITVTTEDGYRTATCTVTVTAKTIAVTGVSLDKTEITLIEGETTTLVATVIPYNATNKNVIWTSGNPAVATVDYAGNVTAVKAGITTIIVSMVDGGRTATCTVTVTERIAVTGVSLDKTEITLFEGECKTLVATVIPENANNKNVFWTSDNTSVATVSDAGVVTAVGAGMTTITVTTEDGYRTATCSVIINNLNNLTFTVSSVDQYGNSYSATFEMVPVAGGTFLMGSQSEDPRLPNYNEWSRPNESPVHEVSLSAFYIGKYEVTQKLWRVIMPDLNWSWSYRGASYPMDWVSYDEVQEFIKRLNQMTGRTFALPTEAQWEFAAGGGNAGHNPDGSRKHLYSGSDDINEVACYHNTGQILPVCVGQMKPNELGLYDMTGNVMEWCSDWYEYYWYEHYGTDAVTDPTGPETGSHNHTYRGGDCQSSYKDCPVSHRNPYHNTLGFRLVLLP